MLGNKEQDLMGGLDSLAALVRAGLTPQDAAGLLDGAALDPRLILLVLRLSGVREGDRIRVDEGRALEVISVAPGKPGVVAVLGIAIDPATAEGGLPGL
jgi:hypothetical protein